MSRETEPTHQKLEILIVDDDPEIAETNGLLVSLTGDEAVITNSAEEAVQMIHQRPFNGIICDGLYNQWVNIMDEATKKGIPVVVYSSSDWIAEAVLAQRGQFLLKPDEKFYDRCRKHFLNPGKRI